MATSMINNGTRVRPFLRRIGCATRNCTKRIRSPSAASAKCWEHLFSVNWATRKCASRPISFSLYFLRFVFFFFSNRLGRRLVYYASILLLMGGRIATIFAVSHYTMFVVAAAIGSLTANSIFQSPLIIAMETSKP